MIKQFPFLEGFVQVSCPTHPLDAVTHFTKRSDQPTSLICATSCRLQIHDVQLLQLKDLIHNYLTTPMQTSERFKKDLQDFQRNVSSWINTLITQIEGLEQINKNIQSLLIKIQDPLLALIQKFQGQTCNRETLLAFSREVEKFLVRDEKGTLSLIQSKDDHLSIRMKVIGHQIDMMTREYSKSKNSFIDICLSSKIEPQTFRAYVEKIKSKGRVSLGELMMLGEGLNGQGQSRDSSIKELTLALLDILQYHEVNKKLGIPKLSFSVDKSLWFKYSQAEQSLIMQYLQGIASLDFVKELEICASNAKDMIALFKYIQFEQPQVEERFYARSVIIPP